MAKHSDPEPASGRGDRLLVALVVMAGATFVAAALWLLAGLR